MATIVLRNVKGSPLTNNEVDGNFSNINSEVSVVNANVGVLSSLTTTAKSNAVVAVNEVRALAVTVNSNVGILSNLVTDATSNLVSAINEVYSKTDDRSIEVLGDISGTVGLDLSTATNFVANISGITTFEVSNLVSNRINTLTLYLGNPGMYTITWPTNTVFNRGDTPVLANTGTTAIVLETYNQGNSWIGVQVWRSND